MFDNLGKSLTKITERLRGIKRLTDSNIESAISDIRIALLEADVNLSVVREFLDSVKAEALGKANIASTSPYETFVKIVYDNLVKVLGSESSSISFRPKSLTKILLTGLQGSGKTTTAAKLAVHIKSKGYRPILVSLDIYRPAAILQLERLAFSEKIEFYKPDDENFNDQEKILKQAIEAASYRDCNCIIVDTAGRLAIDEEMMKELVFIKNLFPFDETLLIADSMTGQDAVNTAKIFNEKLSLTGVILTKLDGDTRSGAALSIKHVTKASIKFIGTGEKIDQLSEFHPDRIARRILGMGDILTLVETAQKKIDSKQGMKHAEKIISANFTLADFLEQIKMINSLGSLESIMKMIPSAPNLKPKSVDSKDLKKTESIILSMTLKERNNPMLINISRKKRIARGSGVLVHDVERVIKNFMKSKKVMKNLGKIGSKMGGLQDLFKKFS